MVDWGPKIHTIFAKGFQSLDHMMLVTWSWRGLFRP